MYGRGELPMEFVSSSVFDQERLRIRSGEGFQSRSNFTRGYKASDHFPQILQLIIGENMILEDFSWAFLVSHLHQI